MNKHTVLLADDHQIVRTGLSAIFGFTKDFCVVGEASDGAEAVAMSAKLKPDVIIMDLLMPDMNGADATREIIGKVPDTHIVILTTYATSVEVLKAIEAGAVGAFSKDTPNDALIEGIRKVLSGEQIFSDDIRRQVLADRTASDLTRRQHDILNEVARGLSNKDIARIYDISEDGVKSHLRTVFAKLGAANRSEAITIALKKHLLKI